MILSFGSTGTEVRQLQDHLNKLPPTNLAPLAVDGIFGPKTRGRVQEFQRNNNLVADGIVGPVTMGAILELLRQLGIIPPPPVTPGAVRPITKETLGMDGPNNLILQILPAIGVIDVPTYRPNDASNDLQFFSVPGTIGRLGIFAAKKGNLERALILLLPKEGRPDRVIIAITQTFQQASATLDPLGWSNPLSPALIKFTLLKHVINRWGAQTLASKKQMAFLYIVRAKGNELGPFAHDGPFVRQTLTELAALTGGAFTFDHVETFTFSSGIHEFNTFVNSLSGHLNVEAVYTIDPAKAAPAVRPKGAIRKQYLSGETGGPRPGFEFIGFDRWKNEFAFSTPLAQQKNKFQYLHNHCMPLYILYLALQTG